MRNSVAAFWACCPESTLLCGPFSDRVYLQYHCWLQLLVSVVMWKHTDETTVPFIRLSHCLLFLNNYMTILCRTQLNQHKQKPDILLSASLSIQPRETEGLCAFVCVCFSGVCVSMWEREAGIWQGCVHECRRRIFNSTQYFNPNSAAFLSY